LAVGAQAVVAHPGEQPVRGLHLPRKRPGVRLLVESIDGIAIPDVAAIRLLVLELVIHGLESCLLELCNSIGHRDDLLWSAHA